MRKTPKMLLLNSLYMHVYETGNCYIHICGHTLITQKNTKFPFINKVFFEVIPKEYPTNAYVHLTEHVITYKLQVRASLSTHFYSKYDQFQMLF